MSGERRTIHVDVGLLVSTIAALICLWRGNVPAATVWALLAIANRSWK